MSRFQRCVIALLFSSPLLLFADARLQNIATRGLVGSGNDVLIGGFVLQGVEEKTLLIRAIGPSLAQDGVSGALTDPTLSLFAGSQLLEVNNDWQLHPRAAEIPPDLEPRDARESVVLVDVLPGAYTAIVEGVDGGIGVGLIEVFELSNTGVNRLQNLSTRGFVGRGDNVLIGGLVINGDEAKPVVIRAKGPSLQAQGIGNPLPDPKITLFSGGTVLALNDDWQNHSRIADVPDDLKPDSALESILYAELAPGAYTAIVDGYNGATGVGIVEIFEIIDLDPNADTDGDGIPNSEDADDDNDGVEDTRDPAPTNAFITPPTATITASAAEGMAPLAVVFDGSASVAGADEISSYAWSFGDGATASGAVIEHTYLIGGSFEATLVVTNEDGLSHSVSVNTNVSGDPGPFSLSGTIDIQGILATDGDVNESSSPLRPNNTLGTAQQISNPVSVSGYLNTRFGGPQGNLFLSGDALDFYRFNAAGGEVLNLNIADPDNVDLDIALFDAQGVLIDFSLGITRFESITLPDVAGTYFVEVSIFSGSGSNYILTLGRDIALAGMGWTGATDFEPAQVILREKAGAKGQVRSMLAAMNVTASFIDPGVSMPALLRFPHVSELVQVVNVMSAASKYPVPLATGIVEQKYWTLLAAKALRQEAGVVYAEPNYRYQALAVPNDEFYFRQWHYDQINLPAAWDVTTGSDDVTVAVLDTGVISHPDLNSRLTDDGFDFIQDLSLSVDGDGRDVNPADPGDGLEITGCNQADRQVSSFHGTHVAGTVGARTNDGSGVAGVTWATRIMPLRVLGCGGGSNFDILQAVLYAAGLDNASGKKPARPADIANLSLGGPGFSQAAQDVFLAARDAGLIVIAAAGNSGDQGNPTNFPAAYDGVVAVAATDQNDITTSYSSFGSYVDVAAPGGDFRQDVDADGFGDGVLSTKGAVVNGALRANFDFENGTSMAAPHVAGVAALMKAVHPGLTPTEFDNALAGGFMTIDLGAPGRDDRYGHGRIDARRAVDIANQLAGGAPVPENPILNLSSNVLNFGQTLSTLDLNVFNSGTGNLTITGVTVSDGFVSLTPPASSSGLGTYLVSINRTGLAVGANTSVVTFDSTAGPRTLTLVFEVVGTGGTIKLDAGKHFVLLFDVISQQVVAEAQAVAVDGLYAYRFDNQPPSIYLVFAGSDPDNDFVICGAAEACGTYPIEDSPAEVVLNQDVSGIDFGTGYVVPVDAQGQDAAIETDVTSMKSKVQQAQCVQGPCSWKRRLP